MSPPALPRSTVIPGRALTTLAALTVALAAAFVAAPRMLASIGPGGFAGRHDLVAALRESFVQYWRNGDRDLSPDLERVVDYWFRYHLAKAAIAAILLIVLVSLGVLVWKAFLTAGDRGAGTKGALAVAGVVVTMLAVLSLTAVMANIQGIIAPFSSLLPMVTAGATGVRLTGTLDQIRQQLAGATSAGGHTSPALETMISDFARYHVAMAVIASIVAAILIGVSAVLWRTFTRSKPSRRTRRVLGSFGALSGLLALALIVVAVANTATAADPAPALQAFFEGGW